MLKQLMLGCVAGATMSATAATTVFSDGDFAPIWSVVTPTNGTTADPDAGGGGSEATSVAPSGGNPDAYLDIRLNIGSSNRIVGAFL